MIINKKFVMRGSRLICLVGFLLWASTVFGQHMASKNCYIPAGRTSCAPHFVIVGSMKCGTTSLYSYLLNHHQVIPIPQNATLQGPILANKEVRFFLDPAYSSQIKHLGFNATINKYFNVFPYILPEDNTISGEASPMYVVSKKLNPLKL